MKASKGDTIKPNTVKSGPTSIDTGPLFPRLHINETEKAGPRAPPRNKMALYEQFTVPSHRFLQTNRASASSSSSYQHKQHHQHHHHQQQQQQQPQHYQSDQYPYAYMPCYMSPSIPYANAQPGIPMFAQPAYGVNSCGMSSGSTVVNEEEHQKVPKAQKSEKSASSGPSRILSRDGACSGSKIQEKRNKDLPDVIASSSSSSIMHDKKSSKLLHSLPLSSPSQKPHPESSNLSRTISSTERQNFNEITGSFNESLNTVDARSSRLVKPAEKNEESRSPGPDKSASENDCHEVVGSLSSAGFLYRQTGSADVIFQEKHKILTQSSPEPGMSGENMTSTDCPALTMEDRCCSPSEIPPKSRIGDGQLADIEKGDVNSCVFSSHGVVKNHEESSGESKNNNSEVSEPSQQATAAKVGSSDDSAVSILISVSAPLFKPKDVIQVVGQQQFWKARKTLLRQQRIFSDQVFQLHKLIRVQQLLAETPGTLLDEEMHFGVIEDSEESPSRTVLGEATPPPEKAQKSDSCFKEPKKSESLQAGLSSRSAGCHQTVPDTTNSNPAPTSFNSTGVSAWGYPSMAMGQWFNPMATQGRPFLYPPYGAAFPPAQTAAGPFSSTVMGQVSPMVPFGIPFYGQYGSIPATTENAAPLGQSLKDAPGSWNIMQMNFNQAVSAAFGKAVPAGSGASVNQATPLPGVNTSNVAGMQQQWGSKINAVLPTMPQAETSSPSVFVSTSTLSALNSKKSANNQEEDGVAQNLDLGGTFRSIASNVCEDNHIDDEEKMRKWSKFQREVAQVSVNMEAADEGSPESLGNALELFPTVPSLSPNSKTKARAAHKAEGWRGKVIKAVPHPAVAAPQSTAGILLSLQRERQH